MSEKINKKQISCNHCGKRHVDGDKFSEFNHRKHLCEYCNRYFFDKERGIGV